MNPIFAMICRRAVFVLTGTLLAMPANPVYGSATGSSLARSGFGGQHPTPILIKGIRVLAPGGGLEPAVLPENTNAVIEVEVADNPNAASLGTGSTNCELGRDLEISFRARYDRNGPAVPITAFDDPAPPPFEQFTYRVTVPKPTPSTIRIPVRTGKVLGNTVAYITGHTGSYYYFHRAKPIRVYRPDGYNPDYRYPRPDTSGQ